MRRLVTSLLLVTMVMGLSGCGQSEPEDPDLMAGQAVYAKCAVCHGREGNGGVGPALAGVIATFPDCDTQVNWITLGSQGWKDEVGDTYGSGATPIEGSMPGFGSLSDYDRRAVAFYERVEFGGGDPAAEREACGL